MARQMKDSGIEWVGDIPADWDVKKGKWILEHLEKPINEEDGVITCFRDGEVTLRSNRREDGFTFALQEIGYQGIDVGDLVVHGMDGFAGAIGISDSRGKASPVLQVLDSSENKRYIMYYLRNMAYNGIFIALATGIRVRSCDTNWNKLKELPFIIPPKDEQEKIASHIEQTCAEIDTVIAKTKATIEEYKKLKQSIITEAVTKGIRGDRPMKDSGIEWIGEIPSTWKVIKVKWLLDERKERSETGEEEPLSMSQKFGLIPTKEMDMIPNMASSFVGAKLVYAGDLVFNKLKAHLGVFAVSKYEGLVSPDYAVYYPTGVANVKYLEYLFKTPQYIAEFRKKSSGVGAGLTRLYTDDLFSIYCSLPPMEEQEEIIAYLDKKCAEMDTLIARKTALLTEMETYKKSVIYEYVTGKKEVASASTQAVTVIYPYFPAVLATNKPRFAQAVLMSKILDSNVSNMGRVKLTKMLFTIEHSLGFDFDTEYSREAAGPLDSSIYECERVISRANKWFYINSSKYGVSYKPQGDMSKYKKYYEQYFSEYNEEIERIINVFRNYSLDQAEIVATLYGAWNDFIIDNKEFTDEDIVNDVLNNWNDSKKRFSKDIWLRAIESMRKNNLVPKGYGKHTVTNPNS